MRDVADIYQLDKAELLVRIEHLERLSPHNRSKFESIIVRAFKLGKEAATLTNK